MTTEQKIKELKAEARNLQKEQYNLINSRRDANRFGDCEKRLEKIYREIDNLK